MNVDMSKRQDLFETMPIMKAIMIMSLPMVLSSLVTILYNLSDTFFVATLNDSLQTAAVTLSAPILLSFNMNIYISHQIIKKVYPKYGDWITVFNVLTLGFFRSISLFLVRNK